MDGWVNGQMDGWIDGWMRGNVLLGILVHAVCRLRSSIIYCLQAGESGKLVGYHGSVQVRRSLNWEVNAVTL
jgi:hypothetical protein